MYKNSDFAFKKTHSYSFTKLEKKHDKEHYILRSMINSEPYFLISKRVVNFEIGRAYT